MSSALPDVRIKEWATPVQCTYIDAVLEHGSARAAARALGCNKSSIRASIIAAEKTAALHLYSPAHHLTRPIAPGLKARGTSQLFRRGEAEPVLEWIKTSADAEAQAAIFKAALEALAEELPRLAPLPAPPVTSGALCNVYTLTDSHVGMLAWGEEAGAPWDLKIAEHVLTGCFEQMILAAPQSKIGFVNQLGDFLHYDSSINPVTPMHGHILDADGRMPKMVKVAIRILRRVIDMALQRHGHVVVLLAEGNHDMTSSVWLRAMFAALYENEPRVEVIESALPYYTYQHGETMLAFHHGHLSKNEQLPILFAAQFPKIWGATTKRYAHTGHRHHQHEKEHSGMTVLQHPTLAARDAYAARGGWVADRKVTAVTYHSAHGEVARNTVCPEMLSPVL